MDLENGWERRDIVWRKKDSFKKTALVIGYALA